MRHGLIVLGLSWLAMALCGCTRGNMGQVAVSTPSPTPCVAHLLLETTPSGAAIMIDGDFHGRAPLRLELAPGTHMIHAELDGNAPRETTVDLACRPQQITLTLTDNSPPELTVGDLPTAIVRGEALHIAAMAEDASGIDRIELWLDGALRFTAPGSTLDQSATTDDLLDGEHIVRIIAHDKSGLSHGQERRLMVIQPTSTSMAPPTSAPPTDAPATATLSPPTSNPEPTASPTTARSPIKPVHVSWSEITVPTYRYRQALYTDASAGHSYPLLHRDQVGGPEPRTYQVIILRNAYLELTLMPELGGRIYQCRFLPTNQALFYNNKVIKPTHWGPEDQGWWLAVGGIEFCLPVDEHGYLSAEPWMATIDQRKDGSARVTMAIFERTRQIEAQITISLAPGESRFDIDSRLTNASAETQSLQYWINAILAPGADTIGPELRFYYPTSEMIVHSTGDDWLPGAGATIDWPIHEGRDLGSYSTWRNWLGVFAPKVTAGYSAVYDHGTRIGMVRVFPAEIARGSKLFGFGRGFGDSRAYTDDSSQYIEMWGGWTPTFWDYADLGAGETLAWSETWYPVAGTDGVTMATGDLAAQLAITNERLAGAVMATRSGQWRVQVLVDSHVVAQTALSLEPGSAEQIDLPVPGGNTGAPRAVRIVDGNGAVKLTQALDGQER